MSEYLPPNETLPIFNPSNFLSSSSSLTINEANDLYLKLSGGSLTGDLLLLGSSGNSPKLAFGADKTNYINLVSNVMDFNVNGGSFSFLGGRVSIASSNVYNGSLNTGALVLPTGTGGGLFCAGASAFNDHLFLLSTEASSSNITGALQCSGGIYVNSASLFGDGVTITNNLTSTSGNFITQSTTAQLQSNNIRSISSNVVNMFPATDLGTGTMITQISPSSAGWASTGTAKLQLGDSNHFLSAVNGAGVTLSTANTLAISATTATNVTGGQVTFSPFVQFNGSSSQTFSYGFLNGSGTTGTGNSTNNYSLAASNHIKAVEFNATCSKLIKDISEVDVSKNLTTMSDIKNKFMSLSFAKYQYTDKLRNNSDSYVGLIAEDVQEKFNAYVDSSYSEYVPNIYCKGNVDIPFQGNNKSIRLLGNPHDLSNIFESTLLAYDNAGNSIILSGCRITMAYDNMWVISFEDSSSPLFNGQAIFIYGDYRPLPTVNKNAIFEIGMVLLQEYIKKVDLLLS